MKEDSIGISDLNSFKSDIGMSIFRNVENKPEGISALSVFSSRLNNAGWFSQIGLSSNNIYQRTFDQTNDEWSDWRKI